jgi:nucleotide-binding universal stress UspA family protein
VRVVVGLDGSGPSEVARQLVESIGWPMGTQFVFAAAYGGRLRPQSDAAGVGWFHAASESTPRPDLLDELDLMAEPLRKAGYVVEVRVERGHAGHVLRELAAEGAADLVVVGSRGHGTAASAILGSTSAELVDHSVCPVLVARAPRVSRALVATDGSPSAVAIPAVLARWRILRDIRFEVVSVAPRAMPASDYLVTAWAPPTEVVRPADDDQARRHQRFADNLVEDLASAGFSATGLLRYGDPAREIVAGAREGHDDLIITGSRGLGDLQRIMIGSVAHDVLLHSHASVLIMRGHVPARLEERVRVAVGSLSAS